jgi:hypothetical protein
MLLAAPCPMGDESTEWLVQPRARSEIPLFYLQAGGSTFRSHAGERISHQIAPHGFIPSFPPGASPRTHAVFVRHRGKQEPGVTGAILELSRLRTGVMQPTRCPGQTGWPSGGRPAPLTSQARSLKHTNFTQWPSRITPHHVQCLRRLQLRSGCGSWAVLRLRGLSA